MNPAELKVRGENAARILNDPLVIEALATIERDIIEMWVACPERDIEGKNLLQLHIRHARKFRDILKGVMESGKLADFRDKQTTIFERTVEAARNFTRR